MELIWINDGSDKIHTTILKKLLERFQKTTRFTKVVYHENDGNKGIGFTLNAGIQMCSHEIIIKMDSDDIMIENRVIEQYTYMKENPDIKYAGGRFKCLTTKVITAVVLITRP